MIKTMAVMLFIVGAFLFGFAYHSIDLAVNAKFDGLDINGWGYVQDIPTMYLNGSRSLFLSGAFMISGFVMLYAAKERLKWLGHH